jgi:hypothetical protein
MHVVESDFKIGSYWYKAGRPGRRVLTGMSEHGNYIIRVEYDNKPSTVVTLRWSHIEKSFRNKTYIQLNSPEPTINLEEEFELGDLIYSDITNRLLRIKGISKYGLMLGSIQQDVKPFKVTAEEISDALTNGAYKPFNIRPGDVFRKKNGPNGKYDRKVVKIDFNSITFEYINILKKGADNTFNLKISTFLYKLEKHEYQLIKNDLIDEKKRITKTEQSSEGSTANRLPIRTRQIAVGSRLIGNQTILSKNRATIIRSKISGTARFE